MRNAAEEIPLNVPNRPGCGTAGIQPCWHPSYESTRSDAAELVYAAYNMTGFYLQTDGPAGQAFPRRLAESNGVGIMDGVQAFVSTPSTTPPMGQFMAGPLGVGDAFNLHFIESGPDRRYYATSTGPSTGNTPDALLNHPYSSSGTARFCTDPSGNEYLCRDEARIDTNFYLTSGNSYEYKTYYASGSNEWWSEYYNTSTNQWTRLTTVTQLGTSAMREVFGAAETSSFNFPSDTIRITDARAHTSGGSWAGWCYDAGITPVKMFSSTFSSCPPPNTQPFTWDTRYIR